MGQAQSMSSSGPGCEDCPGYSGIERSPDKIRTLPTDTDRYVQGSAIGGTPVIARPGTEVPAGVLYPGDVAPGGQITYPGGVIPGRVGTYSGVPGVSPEIYPGGIQPGTVTPKADKIYPGGIRPGTVISEADKIYPGGVRPGSVTSGSDGTYPVGVRPGTIIPGSDTTYAGSVRPGTMAPGIGATYPGGIRPRIVTPGVGTTYPGTIQPGTVIPGISATYPGGIRPGIVIPGVGATYPGVVQPGTATPGVGKTYPGAVQPGRVVPGITTGVGTGIETYPGGIYQPGVHPGQGTHPSDGIVTTSITTGTATAVTGVNTYPGGIAPGKDLSVTYPGVSETGIYPGAGIYPGDVRFKTISGTRADTYPDGVAPGNTGQGIYPSDRQQTGMSYIGGLPSTLPGQMVTTTGSVGAGTQIITYPSGQITEGQAIYPSSSGTIQSSRIPEGISGASGTKVMYPIGTYPGSATIPVTYPGGDTYPASNVQQITSPGVILYPGQAIYPGGVDQVSPYPSGQHPGASTEIFRGTGKPEGFQYPTGTIDGQRTTGETRIDITGQYHGSYPGEISGPRIGIGQYPERSFTEMGETAGTGEISQGGDLGRPMGVMDNGAESQASSSVQQIESGTQASASAQGKYGSGTAQSQVTGTYSGSGTFSAQAGTSDANKSAQTEISGGKEGTTSIAQGIADHGKSQTQVHLDSDSGATSTGAQSSGWNHGTNSQVQASSRGGMADAQANGEGSTSSQAQIGFQPYLKNEDEKVEKNVTPFRGSGTASAQSGIHQGQSQSQLQGSFQYGITYTGAAQAGSGSGVALSRKPFNFNITDTDVFKPFKSDPLLKKLNIDSAQLSPPTSQNYENKQNDRKKDLQSRSTSKQTVVVSSKDNPSNDKKVRTTEKLQTNDSIYDEYDEYADEEDYSTDSRLTGEGFQEKFSETLPNPDHQKLSNTTRQQSHSQIQTIQIAKGNQYGIQASQDSNVPQTGDTLQPGESVSGYTIPVGFRGRVVSTSGTKTIAQGDGESQSQTVSLIPKDLNNTKSPITKTRSLQTNHERYVSRHISNSKIQNSFVNQKVSSDKHTRPTSAVAMKPSYYTVTNSFAGKINGSNEPKKYEHRYYTKSSTCGYFTFSCNVVYGSNGRTKICKPKVPTYPDGTPMKC